MNGTCTFHVSGVCQFGKNCVNRHEMSSKMNIDAPSTSNQIVGKTPTDQPIIKATIDLTTDDSIDDDYHKLHTELMLLKKENTKLNGKLATLKATTMIIKQKLQKEITKSSKMTEVLNEALFEDEEYQCPICREVFIKPVLMNCGHMFCEWCIDKWSEKYNHCPTCRVMVVNYTHCLNMDNIIEKRMELMPDKIRLTHQHFKESRAKEKQTSIQIGINRRQLELKTMSLNTRQPSNM